MHGLRPRKATGGREASRLEDPDQPFTDAAPRSRDEDEDIHAAGPAGGGTAIGGLAGTNIGEGDPDDGNLEGALGSGNSDVALDDDHKDTSADDGPSGAPSAAASPIAAPSVARPVAGLPPAGPRRQPGRSMMARYRQARGSPRWC